MPTAGRFLENLVTFIQRQCVQTGVVVRSPELFYNNGKQIGEIDITIRGKFGMALLFVGIECRDRPASGPQGVPWITELSGKKTLLGVDKMVAVSSTGFVPEAIEAAKRMGVDLFVVSDVTSEELSHQPFFPVGTPIEVRLFKKGMNWGPRYWTTDAVTIETKRRVSMVLTLPDFS